MDMSTFMPHGHCYLWRTDILLMHIFGDGITTLSYFSIPVALWVFWKKTRHNDQKLSSVLLCFAAFIFMCGLTHFYSIYTTWVPSYFIEGVLKLCTAVISIVTAILCWYLLPDLLRIPSASELSIVNSKLKSVNFSLEKKVTAATKSLQQSNLALGAEVKERNNLLAKLKYLQESTNDGWFVFDFKEGKYEFSHKFVSQVEIPYSGNEDGMLYLESAMQPKSRVLFRELIGDLCEMSENSEKMAQEIKVTTNASTAKTKRSIISC